MNKAFTIILVLMIIGAVAFTAWLFIQNLLEADPSIAAAVIGAFAVIAGGIWSQHSNRRREINSRHFIEKKNAYIKLIELIFYLIKAEKGDKELSEKEMENKLFDFKKELMVWGDEEVIEAMQNFEGKSASMTNESDPSMILLAVDDLLRAIRKDLGHNDYNLKKGDLVGMLIIAEDREKIIINKSKKETS